MFEINKITFKFIYKRLVLLKIIKIITTDLISVYPKLSPAVDQDILLTESGKDLDQILQWNGWNTSDTEGK